MGLGRTAGRDRADLIAGGGIEHREFWDAARDAKSEHRVRMRTHPEVLEHLWSRVRNDQFPASVALLM